MIRPRLTIRARLTLLYTGLFAVCGAVAVVVSYILVAQLGASAQSQQPGKPRSIPGSVLAQCRPERPSTIVNKNAIAQCISALQRQGAQAQRDLVLSHLLEYSLITLGVVIVLAALFGWLFAGRALRPLHRITAAARGASEHNLSARVALAGPHDELRELADTFDEMLGRLQAAFEGQRHFIANASHELRTPLTVMGTSVDVVLGNPKSTPEELRAMATDIRAAVDRAEQLIGSLLILARSERGLTVSEDIDLATVAEDVLDSAGLGGGWVRRTLEPAPISGDPVLIERLIANLVDNAVRYNNATRDVWIATRTEVGRSKLTVVNTGPVVTPADTERIFQPFQRLDERTSQAGFGLGLAIVASIAAIHSGTIRARPREGGGLSITVAIPTVDARAQRAEGRVTERSVSLVL